jgi:hypothetical protein
MKKNSIADRIPAHIRPILWALFWLALGGFSIWLHLRLINNAADDAYIHLRIARNLAQAGQPYYNLNDPVLASSSILWTLVLGGMFKLLPAAPQTLAVLNGILLTSCGWVFYQVCQICLTGRKYSRLIPVGFAMCTVVLAFNASIELMETPLALFLLGLTALLYLREKPVWPYLLGCLPFIRLEFGLFAGIFLLILWFSRREKVFPTVLLTAAGAAPFILYELIEFGTPIPNTVLAKAIVYDISAWQKTYETLATLVSLPLSIQWMVYIGLPLVLFTLALQIRQMAADLKHQQELDPSAARILLTRLSLTLFAIAVMAFYIVGRSENFDWYLPLYTVTFLFALVMQTIHNRNVVTALMIPLLLFEPISFTVNALASPAPATLTAAAARVKNYVQVGEWLYEKYPHATLLSSEIGGLGYGFKGQVLDGAGLISPEALAFHPMQIPEERVNGTIGAIPYRYIKQTRPGLIVSYDFFIKEFLESDYSADYVRQQVPLADEADRERFKDYEWVQSIHVFIRKDIYQP